MKNDTQPDATPYKGFSKHCILCGLAALIGATIAVIVIFGVAPRYAYIFEPRCDIASHLIPSAALSSAKVDPAWRLIIRDMVDSAALQAETRLRDHFTLFLAMAGMGTAIVLGVFSISQARREEKALSEMKELKIEAKDILAEIRECGKTAYTLTDKKYKKIKEIDNNNSEVRYEVPSFDAQSSIEKRELKKNNDVEENVQSPHDSIKGGVGSPASPVRSPEEATSSCQTVQELQTLAEKGNATAQFKLAVMYNRGVGVTKNNKEAVKWFSKIAEKGDPWAQFNLALIYEKGEGIEINITEAKKWYTMSAEQGNARAQVNLGSIYKFGNGVAKDYIEAEKWYNKAAEQNDMKAQFNLGKLYEEGGSGINQNQLMSTLWYLKAAKNGHPLAALEMSSRYFNGKGVPDNYIEAYTFLLLYKSSKNSEQSDTEEQELQQALAKLLTPEQIAVAQKNAAMLWEKINKPKD